MIDAPETPEHSRHWTVLAFAGIAQAFGQRSLELPREEGLDATAFKSRILATHGAGLSSELLQGCRIAVDQRMIDEQETIPYNAQEIALIPPVSGGIDGPNCIPEREHGEKSVLSKAPLESSEVIGDVMHENAGGINVFIGNVRRQSRGLEVTHLEYEAYPKMALRVMDEICHRIESEIPGSRVSIHHRYGRLEIGEAAVIIAASAAHRAPAFDACRRAIEELKKDVPIWKKEFDSQGGTWIGQGP